MKTKQGRGILSTFDISSWIKRLVLSGEHISQLIGNTLRLSNHAVNIPVRMPVNPVIGPTILHEIVFLGRESTVNPASLEVGG